MHQFRTLLLIGAVSFAGALRAETSTTPSGDAAATTTVAYGDAELASYFVSGPLKQAAAELQAGNAARALKVIPAKSTELPVRWLRALTLRAAGNARAARAAFEELAS